MRPMSTHRGQAISDFPDVCKTPVSIVGTVPIPYPNIGTSSAAKTGKKTSPEQVTTRSSSMGTTQGDEAGTLKGHLTVLHHQLMKARPGDATQWHKLLDEYVVTAARAYESMSVSPSQTSVAPSQTKVLLG